MSPLSHYSRWKQWQLYAQMSNLGEEARRKFFNNCFDGVLTVAGIVFGFLILFLQGVPVSTRTITIPGLATALAIGISGIWGAYVSEDAERKKKIREMSLAMGNIPPEDVPPMPPEEEHSEEEMPNSHQRKVKTVNQKAEDFATWVASIVDGVSPVLGSVLPLIPFFFGTSLVWEHFACSFGILFTMLVLLGVFLGRISRGSTGKYIAHLILAAFVTLAVSFLIGVE